MPGESKLTVGIIGRGVVGDALLTVLLKFGAVVRAYDNKADKCLHSIKETLSCDLIFLCLPERQVHPFFCENSRSVEDKPLVLKSTVPIGFTNQLVNAYHLTNIVHCPEFLSERLAFSDTLYPKQFLIGYPSSLCQNHLLHRFCFEYFPEVPVHALSSNETELIKLATNAFFAIKINYLNIINKLCVAHSISWFDVLQGMIRDGRMSPSHTQIPGPDGQFGFGGKCLPKDLTQLIECCREQGIDPGVLYEVHSTNDSDRKRLK